MTQDFYAVKYAEKYELLTGEEVKRIVEIGLLNNKDLSRVQIIRINNLEEFYNIKDT